MNNDIKLVIADDNLFFAEALSENLQLKEGICVKKVISNLSDLIDYSNSNSFDILILDVNFKGDNAINYLNVIRKKPNSFKVIILTSLSDSYNKSMADKYDVELFLSKDDTFKNFHNTIINCHNNSSSQVEKRKSKKLIEIKGVVFTDTKIKILKALYDYAGKTEDEIAEELNIAVSSLKTHKRQLYEMTNTRRIADLIKFGFDNGILLQK